MIMKIENIADVRIPKSYSPVVFVSGCTGQDGSLMVDYLLRETNAYIIGGARRLSVENHLNIHHLEGNPRFQLVNFDLTDSHSMYKLMEVAKPDYFINFAAQSFVASSWDFAEQTNVCNDKGVLNCLQAINHVKPTCRFYNAGSSEEFGNIVYEPQDENHPPRPRSPYGASKVAARQHVKVYRESYGLYAVQGWLFNHEGTRRGEEFVTRKITKGVARLKKQIDYFHQIGFTWEGWKPLELGNLDAKRDWSDAEDMMSAVWKMLNQEKYNDILRDLYVGALMTEPREKVFSGLSKRIKDYVVSSDENHSIREFVEEAFRVADIKDCFWQGKGLDETYSIPCTGLSTHIPLVVVNPKFYRPAEVDVLRGNSNLIRKELGWKPQTSFKQLVKKMVENDLK